jgi:hypothetical protein
MTEQKRQLHAKKDTKAPEVVMKKVVFFQYTSSSRQCSRRKKHEWGGQKKTWLEITSVEFVTLDGPFLHSSSCLFLLSLSPQ